MNTLSSITNLPIDLGRTVEQPTYTNNRFNYISGLMIMALNKVRHKVQGYTSARGFRFEDTDRVINYDLRVVKRWMDYLENYESGAANLEHKNILELGPGMDLGIGLIMLAGGANKYNALDVHNLVRNAPDSFYNALFEYLEKDQLLKAEVEQLKVQLEAFNKKNNDRLNYLVRKDFDLSVFEENSIDLFVSNSAFQQFDNPAKTIQQISHLARPGAYFVALVDLKTHTRWIRERDPLNIYRYPDFLYNALKFKGSQNRVRPYEFKQMLNDNGWGNVKIELRSKLDKKYLDAVQSSLLTRFDVTEAQMEALTFVICAKKNN